MPQHTPTLLPPGSRIMVDLFSSYGLPQKQVIRQNSTKEGRECPQFCVLKMSKYQFKEGGHRTLTPKVLIPRIMALAKPRTHDEDIHNRNTPAHLPSRSKGPPSRMGHKWSKAMTPPPSASGTFALVTVSQQRITECPMSTESVLPQNRIEVPF